MARAPRIILIEPGGARREVEIITMPFRIGRQAGNELTLRDSRISRQQARIVAADGEYVLEDMGSRHGTYVNSEKVLRHELRPKDNVDFGMTDSYRFIYVGDAATLEELIDKVDAPAPTQSGSRELHHLGVLLEVARTLGTGLSLEDVLTTVVDAAIELTRTQRGVLLLADPKGELTTTVARDNQHNSIPHNLVQISSGVLKRVVNSRRELIVSDTGDDTAMGQQESVARLELHTVVCIPVEKLPLIEALDATVSARQGELLGVLYLDSHVASSAFSELDREVLRTLAREAANVIENARLFSASRDKARLDHEVEIASQIQRQLLPKGFPKKPEFEVDGFTLACHSVGGDCYDFVELTGGRHGFFVGDISVKGISASLLASVLQGVIYTTAALDVSPADLVARVNQFFTERSAEERYATLFYGVLDMTGKIKYVNAGHVPPLIRRKDRSLEALESVNLPAGLFPDTEFTGAVAQMYPGDYMVIYTDGVTEATNVAGELLEDAGLRKLLQEFSGQTVQELSEAIRAGVQNFTGGAPQSDDITLVVIQFRGKQP
ncbi:MAG: SpoIIE family protein phosphatase [Candidatus Acidiferrales bacterium]